MFDADCTRASEVMTPLVFAVPPDAPAQLPSGG
jgi:hypothetical protein